MTTKEIDNQKYISSIIENRTKDIFLNLSIPALVEHVIKNAEGELSNSGAVLVSTGEFTGRSPGDKYIVDYGKKYDAEIEWGKINQRITAEAFDQLLDKVLLHLKERKIYVQDVQVGADLKYRRNIRVFSEYAWTSIFSKNLFIDSSEDQNKTPDFIVIQATSFAADPLVDEVKTPTFIIIDFEKRIVLIGNTKYAGEVKKSVFTVMNRLLPSENVLPMHCSANVGQDGDTALFFGLSGTGKTTLSSDPNRSLIGDDEHGWSGDGVFNFEGGCYAKTINLQKKYEPLIWEAVHSFGAILENVVYDNSSRVIDFNDGAITENTRGAYDLSCITSHVKSGKGNHPKNLFFLSTDAFGVLPPISLLTGEQIERYFLAGYTAKLAGTERGIGTQPVATFSSCFGAPFLPMSPKLYASMLQQKISEHHSRVWLINTGWIGGAFGEGTRIDLPYTRAMITAALNDKINLDNAKEDTIFHLIIPEEVPNVPSNILHQQNLWKDQSAYLKTAEKLKRQFEESLSQYN